MNKTIRIANVSIKFTEEGGFMPAIQRGFVVGETTTHVKVYDRENKENTAGPDHSEWFARDSKRVKTEVHDAILDA